MLNTSKTFELAIDHDSQSSTQCLTLLHTRDTYMKIEQGVEEGIIRRRVVCTCA